MVPSKDIITEFSSDAPVQAVKVADGAFLDVLGHGAVTFSGGIKVTFDEKGAVITDSAGNQLRAWLDAAAGVSVIKARTSAGTSSAMVLAAEALAGSFPVGGSEREATMESLFTGGSSV
ncbi:unnamed protein product, partial [Tilletia controversa]